MKVETEQLEFYTDAPWPDEHIVHEDENVVVYKDGYPVTEGHLLFVPKKRDKRSHITICFEYAYDWGVRGIRNYEYEGFNVSMDMGAGALEEAEELLIKCWTETDVTHIGEYWRTKFPAIRPATYSKPYPPIIRSAISDNSIRNLARLCRPFLTAGGHPEDIRRKLALYRKQAAKSGYTESEIESAINGIWFTSDVLVAESTNEAAKIAREHLAIEQKFISDARVKLNSSEWVNSKEGQDLLKHEKLEDGFIYGSVDKVTDQINKLRDAGVNNLMFKVNTGQMDYGISERTIKLLGDEVMPGFS